MAASNRPPLRRSRSNAVIAGVMGGLAEYFQLNATLLRIAFVVISVASAGIPGTLIYLALWILIPRE